MLMVLVTIMGFGLAAVGTYWHTVSQREKERELLFVGLQFRDALRSYAEKTPGKQQYPESLEQLLLDERTPALQRHLRRIYIDPLTGSDEWGLIRRAGRIIGVYSRARGTPLISAGFPEELKQFADAKRYADWRFQVEATTQDDAEKGDSGNSPPIFDPDEHQVEVDNGPSPPPIESKTAQCEKLAALAVEQCWSDVNSDDENNQCQDQAQKDYWACLGA